MRARSNLHRQSGCAITHELRLTWLEYFQRKSESTALSRTLLTEGDSFVTPAVFPDWIRPEEWPEGHVPVCDPVQDLVNGDTALVHGAACA